jgi:hypothetical protein
MCTLTVTTAPPGRVGAWPLRAAPRHGQAEPGHARGEERRHEPGRHGDGEPHHPESDHAQEGGGGAPWVDAHVGQHQPGEEEDGAAVDGELVMEVASQT